jgi:hypothetical protein
MYKQSNKAAQREGVGSGSDKPNDVWIAKQTICTMNSAAKEQTSWW